jgi:hypothetical protein
MIATLKRFFDDINRIANFVTANPMQDVLVTLSPAQLDLLNTPRRRRNKKGDAA